MARIHMYPFGMKTPSKFPKWYEPTPELDTPRFMLADVATAVNLVPGLVKTWISRGVIRLGFYDREGRGAGSRHQFTLRRVICIATTAELVALGVSPAKAGDLALNFTDVEHPEGRFVELPGRTYLIVEPHSEALILATSGKTTFDQVLSKRLPSGDKAASFAVVSGNAIKQRVASRLKERGA
jgi:hypothetical protein